MESLQILALFCLFSHVVWGHGGHHGAGGGKPLEFASEIHNKDHILEHLQHVISTKPKDQLTDEELEFHYFKLHDYDNNNKLDGVEIGKALTHYHDEKTNSTEPQEKKEPVQEVVSDELIGSTIDSALQTFDKDGDGYIEYSEFKRANEDSKKE